MGGDSSGLSSLRAPNPSSRFMCVQILVPSPLSRPFMETYMPRILPLFISSSLLWFISVPALLSFLQRFKTPVRSPYTPSPTPLRLSLHQVFFTIEIFHCHETLTSVVKPGEELVPEKDGTFKFEIDMTDNNCEIIGDEKEMLKGIRVGWTVVMEGFESAFAMMEREGKGRMIGDMRKIWYHEKLPAPGCCKGLMHDSAGIEAEMTVEIGRGQNGVKKVSVGLMSGCRYVGFEDGLRYLQYFLLGRDRI